MTHWCHAPSTNLVARAATRGDDARRLLDARKVCAVRWTSVTAVNLTSATEAGALMEPSLYGLGPWQMWLDPAQIWVGVPVRRGTACAAMTVNAFLAALRTLSASRFARRLTHHPCWFYPSQT